MPQILSALCVLLFSTNSFAFVYEIRTELLKDSKVKSISRISLAGGAEATISSRAHGEDYEIHLKAKEVEANPDQVMLEYQIQEGNAVEEPSNLSVIARLGQETLLETEKAKKSKGKIAIRVVALKKEESN